MRKSKLKNLIKPILFQNKENRVSGSIGFINSIHKKGIKKVKVKITEFELIIKHWVERLKSIERTFKMEYSGSYEIRMFPYANTRLNYLEPLIDQEKLKNIWEESNPNLHTKYQIKGGFLK